MDFAGESGWHIADEKFDDVGESSETLERPALQRLLILIAASQVDRIVVYSVDRLTRKLLDLHRLLELFEQHDVALSVVTDPHFGETAASRLMSNIVAAASEFQQELTRERMSESRLALKRKGRRVAGCVPYGYVADRKSKQLVMDPFTSDHVRQLFEMAAAGMRPRELASLANERRWSEHGRQGPAWTARRVLKLLRNPAYAGWIRNGSGTFRGQHQPIIGQAIFDRARDAIESRRSRPPGRSLPKFTWPLRGILVCGQCGRTMSPSVSGYKQLYYRYYRCRSHAGGKPPCRDVGVSAFEIEEFMRSTLSSNSWQPLDGPHADQAQAFTAAWLGLDKRQQISALAGVVKQIVFDPHGGTMSLTLVEDVVQKLQSRFQ